MRLLIGNTATQYVIGGKDNLLPFSLDKEIREYLRVKVEDAWRVTAFKKHAWDGYRNFVTTSCHFPTGFLPNLCTHLTGLGVSIELIDQRGYIPVLNHELMTAIGEWTLYDYQTPLVKKVDNYLQVGDQILYFPRGIIDAATNAGKNSIMSGIYNNLPKGTKALFLIHSQDIYNQSKAHFSKMFNVGEIRSGKYQLSDFTIAMAKTLKNKIKESMNVRKDMANMQVLFVDEGHRAGGDQYAKLLKDVGAGMRILVSGTPLDNENKVKNMLIVAMTGPVIAKVTNKFLIDNGYSLRPIIHIRLNDVYEPTQQRSYDAEYEACIQRSRTRLQDAVDFIDERLGKKIVIAFEEIAHGLRITRCMRATFPELNVVMVHGEDGERENKIQDYKDGKIDLLIASTILQEGLNLPVMHGLINMMGGKSKIRLKQFIGRLLRLDGESTYVEYLDWFDVGKYVSPHSRKRIKIYLDPNEGFDVRFHYDALKNGTPRPQRKIK